MKIVVVGGSGLVGSRLVAALTSQGHEVVAASRRSGVDAVSGEGLANALSGASVVIDAANAPSFDDAAVMKFFKTSTHNLLAAEAAAGVTHHVALSVVGAERLACTGAVLRGPARDPIKTYPVTVGGEAGRVEVSLAQAAQGV